MKEIIFIFFRTYYFYFVIPAMLFFLYGLYEAGRLRLKKIELFYDDIPDEFDGFRILHITDIHSIGYGRLEKKICSLIRNHSFDMAAFTGDYMIKNHSRASKVIEVVKRIIFNISAPSGVYGIRGNHEKNKFIRQLARNTSLTMLMESAVEIKRGESSIWIAGVNRIHPLKNSKGEKSINQALSAIPDKKSEPFIILLAHTPDYIYLAEKRDVSLVLAGDTHGGQICLPYIGPLRNKAKANKILYQGLHRFGRTNIYISNGVGTTGLPIRINCRPEIAVITLRKRNKALQAAQ